jgi:hypothetical protein
VTRGRSVIPRVAPYPRVTILVASAKWSWTGWSDRLQAIFAFSVGDNL